jgi:hypothetical protein
LGFSFGKYKTEVDGQTDEDEAKYQRWG